MFHAGSNHNNPYSNEKIDVPFIIKTSVLFWIESEALCLKVIKRWYLHIVDIPLEMNLWILEIDVSPSDLYAMILWVDMKSVPSHLFYCKGFKRLSLAVGKFVKLLPSTKRCTRPDKAHFLVG